MQLKAFYEAVLPAEGQYILYQDKRHTLHESIDDLVVATEKRIDTQGLYFATASFDPAKLRAARREEKPKLRTQANVLLLKALRVDIDAGAEKHAKHPEGAYPTQRDALAALIAFAKATELVPTLIVSSGEGLHVYWCLDQPVEPITWHAASVLLNAVGRQHGLLIDAGCTADSARVLRPVGTPHKNGSRVTVLKNTGRTYDFRALDDKLRSFQTDAAEAFTLPAPKAPRPRSINDDVLVPVEGPPASLARVAEHCSAVALMRDTEGNVPEPHWRAVMGVAKYCTDGQELVHEWSSGYVGYDASETQEKFDRWETPPTTCQHFSLMHTGCNSCPYRGKITTPKQVGYIAVAPAMAAAAAPIPDATPPARSAASSSTPVSEPSSSPRTEDSSEPSSCTTDPSLGSGLALPDEPVPGATAECPVPDRPDLFDEESPFFYKVADNRWTLYHTFSEKTKDATGQEVWVRHTVPVAYKLLWVESNSLPGATESGGVVIQFGRVERPGSVRQDRMDMPAGLAADTKTLCKYLIDQGINIAPRSANKNATEHVKEYVTREIIRKQNDMRFVIKDRFGYHFHEGQFLCALGQYTVYPDGVIVKTICNPKLHGLARSLTTQALDAKPSGKWEPGVWREMAPHVASYIQFLRKHYGHEGFAPARLAIAINLASPFLVFAGDSIFNEAEELPATGFVLSLYSEQSGIGKSSLMAAIAAAYGKDTLARKGNDASITPVAAATTAKNTAIYPFLLDEVTQNEATRAAALIDTFANGSGRLRAKSDGSVSKSAETWALVSCVATNVPQRELLTATQKRSDALLMRLMELNFDEIPPNAGDVEAFRADLKAVQQNCGAFGMFQALLAVKAGHEKLTAMTAANVTRAFELLGVGQQFRFFARMLGAMLTNHQLLGRWSPFDMDELVATFKRSIKDTIWYVQENRLTPEGELGALIASLSDRIVVTRSWTRRTGRGGEADVVLNPNVKMPLAGREVQDWGCVLLDSAAVRKWCLEQQMSASSFLHKMEQAGLLVPEDGENKTKQRLTTGIVGMPTTSGYYYKFRTRQGEAVAGDNVVELRAAESAVVEPATNVA